MFGRRKKANNSDATETQLEWLILSCGKFAVDFPEKHGQEIQPGNLIYEAKRIAEQQKLQLSEMTVSTVVAGAMSLTFGVGRQFLDELVDKGWLEDPGWKQLNDADADRLKYVCAQAVTEFLEHDSGQG